METAAHAIGPLIGHRADYKGRGSLGGRPAAGIHLTDVSDKGVLIAPMRTKSRTLRRPKPQFQEKTFTCLNQTGVSFFWNWDFSPNLQVHCAFNYPSHCTVR